MSTEEIRMEPANTPQSGESAAPSAQETYAAGTGATDAASKLNETDLANELREFGKQIEAMFQTARSSTRGKEIEAQLTAAWRDVENGVNNAIAKAQASDVKGTVTGTTKYAADEVQTGLARGLKSLNSWLSQKRTDIEDRRKAREAAESAAAVAGTADNEVSDRFGNDAPVFGQGVHVPEAPTPGGVPPASNQDNLINDRFGDNPPKL
jgi:hypothetical protein